MIVIITSILQCLALVLWAIWAITITTKVNKLEEEQIRQNAVNIMVAKHISQLLTDVDKLVEDHDNV